MRKYFWGIVALIMAISLSAFTSQKKVDSTEFLYWFEYNALTGTGAYLDYGGRNDFTSGTCHVIDGPDCRRGYPIWSLKNQTDPGTGVINDDWHSDRIGTHETPWTYD
ncbi:MAG: hypothetical protein ACTHMV_14450 [Chitinophagaceae bacterium]